MFKEYLQSIGLEELVSKLNTIELNTIVEDFFAADIPDLSDEEIKKLYVYDVPKMSPDGSCSILEEKTDKPYNLAETFGILKQVQDDNINWKKLKNNPQTLRLWRLKKIVHTIYRLTKVEWFGIYRKVKNVEGDLVLVKESYEGIFSRAEFPLTQEFAKKSNNSTVGLSGRAIVIQDVAAHAGAYYKCDGEVNSEFCTPIFDLDNKVIGIIDAEAFAKNHYTSDRLLQIAKVAFDLGQKNLGL